MKTAPFAQKINQAIKNFLLFIFLILSSICISNGQAIQLSLSVNTSQSFKNLDELQTFISQNGVTLTLTNLTQQQQNFEYEVLLSSTNFSIQSNPDVPIEGTIEPGTSKTLNVNELQSLFEGNALLTSQNETVEEFVAKDGNGGVLPEGQYQLCIKLLLKSTGSQISNLGCSNLSFKQLLAPLIQSINFQPCIGINDFTLNPFPNHSITLNILSPSSEINTLNNLNYTYKVFLVELLPDNSLEPTQIIQSLIDGEQPRGLLVNKEITQVSAGQLFLENGDIAIEGLVPTHKYAIAIQARNATNPFEEIPNNGLSPVVSFTYGHAADYFQEFTGPICGQTFQPRSLPTDLQIPSADLVYNGLFIQIGPFLMQMLTGEISNGKIKGSGIVKLDWMSGYPIEVYFEGLEIKYSPQTQKYYVTHGSARTKVVENDLSSRFSDINQFPEFFNFSASETPLHVNLDSKNNFVIKAMRKLKSLPTIANQFHDFPKMIYRTNHKQPGNLAVCSMNFTIEGATMNVILNYPDAQAKQHLYKGILNYPVPTDNIDCVFSSGHTPDVKNYTFEEHEYDPAAPDCNALVKKAVIPWNTVSDSQTPGIGARIGHYFMTNIQSTEEIDGKHKGTAWVYLPWIKEQVQVIFENMEFAADIDNNLGFYVTNGVARTVSSDPFRNELSLTNAKNTEYIEGYTPITGEISKAFNNLLPNVSTNWQTGMSSVKEVPFKYISPELNKKIGIMGMTFYPEYAYMNSLEQVVKGSDTTYLARKNQPASAAGIACNFEGALPMSIEEALPLACKTGNCSEITDEQGGTLVNTISTTDKIRIGCFYITPLSVLNDTGNGFNGTATVKLPFLNAHFKVNLVHVKIKKIGNTNIAISGKADGLIDTSFPTGIAATLINGLKEAKNEAKSMLPPQIYALANTQTQEAQNEFTAVFDEIGKTQRFINQITNENFTTGLPIGYSGDIGASNANAPQVRFGIFGMSFFSNKATMNIVAQTPLIPGIDQSLYFGGMNICFTPFGLSASDATFYLGGDLSLPFANTGNSLKLKGSNSDNQADQVTFLTLENGGFKTLGLKGAIQFSTDLLINEEVANKPVEASFSTEINRGDEFDILATINIPKFHLKDLPDWAFKLEEVSLDLSSAKNTSRLILPTETQPAGLWKGIHAKNVELSLPADFAFGNNQRPKANIDNFILDFDSFMVSLDGHTNIGLALNAGAKLSGLGISLNNFNFKIRNNDFTEFGLNGELSIPIFDHPIPFSAGYADKNFEIGVALNSNLTIEAKKLLDATFVLASGSKILYINKKITFDFSGKVSINSDANGVSLPEMDFTHLKYDGNKLDIGALDISFASPQKWIGGSSDANNLNGEHKSGGFPVTFKNFKPIFTGNFTNGFSLGLGFNFGVNLIGSSGKGEASNTWGFGIDAGFELTGRVSSFSGGLPQFEAVEVTFKETRIDVDVSVCHVVGALKYYKNDAVYGNAFRGCIDVEMKLPGIPFRGGLEGMFGSVGAGSDNFRYFFIEGYVANLSIPIPSTPILFDGFAMGFAYNMLPKANTQTLTDKVMGTSGTSTCDFTLPPKMTPQKEAINFGFALKVQEAASQGYAFNGAMGFSASLNSSDGSPLEFGIDGALSFLKPPAAPVDASLQIQAELQLKYNFVEKVFYGNSAVAVNINKANNGIIGTASMAFYFGNDDWYIYLGNPWGNSGKKNEMAEMEKYAKMTFSVMDVMNLEAGMYFCMGTYGISQYNQVPDKFPREIRSKLNGWLSSNTRSFDPRASSGAGVAFGAYLMGDFNIDLEVFYGSLEFGFGFDLAFVRYMHNPCGNGNFGINNYYATGQIYGFAKGEVGINYNGDPYDLMSADFIAVATFGGPNPTWVKGYVEIDKESSIALIQTAAAAATVGASILVDGAVKFADGIAKKLCFLCDDNYKEEKPKGLVERIVDEVAPNGIQIEFELGNPCAPTLSNSYHDQGNATKIISYILPQITSGEEDRYLEPNRTISVIFSKPLGQTWSFNKLVGENWKTAQRKWVMDKVEIIHSNGQILSHDFVDFSPTEYRYWLIDPQSFKMGNITFTIRLKMQEKIGNGVWNDKPTFDNGAVAEDKMVVKYYWKPVNYEINASDVNFSYPLSGQKYYLQQHGSKFIVLNNYRSEFEELSKNKNDLFAKIYANNQLIGTENFKYSKLNFAESIIEYYTPTLPNSANIRVEFFVKVQTPNTNNTEKATDNSKATNQAKSTTPNTAAYLATNAAARLTTSAQNTNFMGNKTDIKIYTLEFNTSKYNNFTDKMNSYRPSSFVHPASDSYFMTKTFKLDEPWDHFEVGPVSAGHQLYKNMVDNTGGLQPFINEVKMTNNSAWLNDVGQIWQAEYNAGYYVPDPYGGYLDRARWENSNLNNGNIIIEYVQNEEIRAETERHEMIPMPTAGNFEFTFEYQYPEIRNRSVHNKIEQNTPSSATSSNSNTSTNTNIVSTQAINTALISTIQPTDAVRTLLQATTKYKITVPYDGMAAILNKNYDVQKQMILHYNGLGSTIEKIKKK